MVHAPSPPAAMRIFFALWPDPATVHALSAWARHAHTTCGGRIMRPDTLHLTLAFLGSVDANRIEQLIQATSQDIITPGAFHIHRYGVFARQHLIWAGPANADTALTALHDQLWLRLSALDFQPPPHPFRPHVTLLRHVTDATPPGITPEPLHWAYSRYVLVASEPQNGMAQYRVLASSKLPQNA